MLEADIPRCAKSPDFAQKQSKVRRLRIANTVLFYRTFFQIMVYRKENQNILFNLN